MNFNSNEKEIQQDYTLNRISLPIRWSAFEKDSLSDHEGNPECLHQSTCQARTVTEQVAWALEWGLALPGRSLQKQRPAGPFQADEARGYIACSSFRGEKSIRK